MTYAVFALGGIIAGAILEKIFGPDVQSAAKYAESLVKAKFELALVRAESAVQKGEMDAKSLLAKIKSLV